MAYGRLALIRRSAMTHPPGAQPGYRCTPLSAEEKARGEANFTPFVAQMLVASGRFRVSADTPDQVELFQGVARRVSDMLQRSVVSYANGREIVITFGREEAPALALRSPGWAFPRALAGVCRRQIRSSIAAAQAMIIIGRWLWLAGTTHA
jgi:hypothetical protein